MTVNKNRAVERSAVNAFRALSLPPSISCTMKSWRSINTPVYCVVHDPQTDALYWANANASAQVRQARKAKKQLKSIVIDRGRLLSDDTVYIMDNRGRLTRSEARELLAHAR